MDSSSSVDRKYNLILFAVLILSFLIKLVLALLIQSPIRSDSLDYQTLAFSILEGQYAFAGKPTAYVGCGYPLFLSGIYLLFGEGQFYVKLIQSFLETGTGYFFYLLCRKFFNERNSLIAVCMFVFFPSNILFSQAVLSESLFGFFYILILSILLRDDFGKKKSIVFLTGILIGYSILIRTAFLPSVILVILYFIIYRNDLFDGSRSKLGLTSLVFLVGAMLMLLPWSIRNKIDVGTFSLGTTAGINFWAGSNPNSTGTYYFRLDENLPVDYNNEPERDAAYFKLGVDYAISNPVKYLVLGIRKIGYLFSSERLIVTYFYDHVPGETSTQQYRSVNPFFSLLVNLPYFAVILTGTCGLIILDRKRFFIYGFILMWVVTIFMFIGLARYHYVLIPFFVIGAMNFLVNKNLFWRNLSFTKKTIAVISCLFLISVWAAEFYLLIK